MLIEIERVLLKEEHDMALVLGETNSTLTGVLAASKPCIKAGYVMAGVRSFDRMIPEETNRCNMEEAFLGMDGDINKD